MFAFFIANIGTVFFDMLFSEEFYFFFSVRRQISPIHSTIEVAEIIMAQSVMESGTTLKNLPPICTIAICPTRMKRAISSKPPQSFMWKAERPVEKALALNIFQNCRNTNMVKNSDSS